MRIVFFNRSYWPDFGATGQLLTELTQDLKRQYGWDVVVVAGSEATSSPGIVASEEREGVEILRAKGTRLSKRRFVGRFVNYVTFFLSAIVASFRVGRPEVVVALTDPPIIGLVAYATAKRTGARFVFLCQDIFPEVASVLEDFRSSFVNSLLERVNRFLVGRADRIIALGETMKRRLVDGKGAPAERVAVIHNWADSGVIAPGEKDNPFSREHGLADRFVVMHSGNMGLSQNLDLLLDAAAAVPEAVFLLVGDGARKTFLEEDARRRNLANVRFLPYQLRERMRDSYATADVFIVSLKSGLAGYIVPSKLYGILAAGRPYVAAIDEDSEVALITREHDCGLLVVPGNAEGLTRAIETLRDDPDLRRRLADNARRASAQFERQKQVRAYHDLFTRELHERSARADAALETSA